MALSINSLALIRTKKQGAPHKTPEDEADDNRGACAPYITEEGENMAKQPQKPEKPQKPQKPQKPEKQS